MLRFDLHLAHTPDRRPRRSPRDWVLILTWVLVLIGVGQLAAGWAAVAVAMHAR